MRSAPASGRRLLFPAGCFQHPASSGNKLPGYPGKTSAFVKSRPKDDPAKPRSEAVQRLAWLNGQKLHRDCLEVKEKMIIDGRCGNRATGAATLICLLLIVNLTGCGRAIAPSATLRYVRIEPLLAYHPSWKQLAELENQVALIGKQGGASSANAFVLPDFPAPLPPNVSVTLSQGVERQSQIERDARQYAEGLSRSLSATNRILIGQEQRREQKRVEKELGAKLLEAERILREVNLVKQFAIMEKIKSFSFRQAILLSQINVYLQVTRSDNLALSKSQTELKAVVNEIEGLNESLRNLKNADLTAQSNSKRSAILKSLEAMSAERLAKRQSDLDADKDEKVAEALQVQKLDPVPIPETAALPIKAVSSILTLPATGFLPGKNTEATMAGVSAQNRLLESSRQQRELLLVEIRRDTEQATEQAALRHGWKLVGSNLKGASDATEEMKALLREQWRRTP